jgi:hypothetical protein
VQKIMSNLTKATSRCDRLVRQVYVCNDQIRQIQLQREQHRVGALQVFLYSRPSPRAPESPRAQESTERKSKSVSGTDHLSSATRPTSTATIRPTRLSSVNTPTQQNAFSTSPNKGSARFSTATVISLNHFGFPLPPDRQMDIHRHSDSPSYIGTPVDHPPGMSHGLQGQPTKSSFILLVTAIPPRLHSRRHFSSTCLTHRGESQRFPTLSTTAIPKLVVPHPYGSRSVVRGGRVGL